MLVMFVVGMPVFVLQFLMDVRMFFDDHNLDRISSGNLTSQIVVNRPAQTGPGNQERPDHDNNAPACPAVDSVIPKSRATSAART